jgi:hypothetical protein
VFVETDDGLTGYGAPTGTPVMKVLVEDVLGPQLVGEDPTPSPVLVDDAGPRRLRPQTCPFRQACCQPQATCTRPSR